MAIYLYACPVIWSYWLNHFLLINTIDGKKVKKKKPEKDKEEPEKEKEKEPKKKTKSAPKKKKGTLLVLCV